MLYRLEPNPEADKDRMVLGYPWLEVLAIFPDAVERALPRDYGNWAMATLHLVALCRSDHGMISISFSDITVAPDDGNDAEYVLV